MRAARHEDAASRRDDSGLALLDVLLGMAIFALIVIIAIQAIGQFRQRAYQTAVSADAQQVAVGLESSAADAQTYPANLTAMGVWVADSANGVNLTRGNSVGKYISYGSTFTLCIEHKTGGALDAYAVYDSAKGAIVEAQRGGGCAGAEVYSTPFGCPTIAFSALTSPYTLDGSVYRSINYGVGSLNPEARVLNPGGGLPSFAVNESRGFYTNTTRFKVSEGFSYSGFPVQSTNSGARASTGCATVNYTVAPA